MNTKQRENVKDTSAAKVDGSIAIMVIESLPTETRHRTVIASGDHRQSVADFCSSNAHSRFEFCDQVLIHYESIVFKRASRFQTAIHVGIVDEEALASMTLSWPPCDWKSNIRSNRSSNEVKEERQITASLRCVQYDFFSFLFMGILFCSSTSWNEQKTVSVLKCAIASRNSSWEKRFVNFHPCHSDARSVLQKRSTGDSLDE